MTDGGGTAHRQATIRRTLPALIGGQICLHACMTGVRVAAPLLVLRGGGSAVQVGLLLGLFAMAPVLISLRAGRMADRHGYHRPMRLAVALTAAGGLLAAAATLPGGGFGAFGTFSPAAAFATRFGLLCAAAVACGIGANLGLIVIQRSAGRLVTQLSAADASPPSPSHSLPNHDLTRVFSWLGLAPALANVVGPLLAGSLIDAAGFGTAFGALAALPLLALAWSRRVPVEPPSVPPPAAAAQTAWSLFASPGLKRLLAVNWVLSSSWDFHSFVLPVLGYQRGFSASAIGAILGVFAAAVAAVRFAIPLLLHRRRQPLREAQVLHGAMWMIAAVFAVYPLVDAPLPMALCAAWLGVALGSVQPMVMTALHRLTPSHRHGEAIALRSMTINTASALMPLLFGAAGAAIGASGLFWAMALVAAAGSFAARRAGEP